MFPILSNNQGTLEEFIDQWSQFYNYRPVTNLGGDVYTKLISKSHFSANDVYEMYLWKNGRKLSDKKKNVVERIMGKVDVINEFKQTDFDLDSFYRAFKEESDGVWKLFLLHIIKPYTYPMFDQHVYRAYMFLTHKMTDELKQIQRNIMNFYSGIYLPFVNHFSFTQLEDLIKFDRSLFAFGQFLKSNYAELLTRNAINISFFKKAFQHVYEKVNTQTDPKIKDLLELRDEYMLPERHSEIFDLGEKLMFHIHQAGLENKYKFEQSEGTDMVFSLLKAIQDKHHFTDYEVFLLYDRI